MPTALDTAPTALRERLFRLALVLFLAAIGFSLGGSLLLQLWPGLGAVFGTLLPWFIKVPTWTYMAMLPVLVFLLYLPVLGPAASGFFLGWGFFIGMVAELVGTTTGLPFGPYDYTAFLGPKIMDKVPYFVPLSWYAMGLLSLDLARRLGLARHQRIFAGAVFMVLWDVALDPAMSKGMPFWIYRTEGFFFGMPAENWIGWLVTSSVILWGFEVLGGEPAPPQRGAPVLWLLNALFPLALSVLYGLATAAFIGALAVALPFLALAARGALRDEFTRSALRLSARD